MSNKPSSAAERLRALSFWTGPVTFQPLEGGLSNETFRVSHDGQDFVVRLGGDVPVHHVFREDEHRVARAAFSAGFAPELVFSGPDVSVFRFIAGRTYTARDVRDNLACLAELLRRFHHEMPEYVRGPGRLLCPFHIIRDYAATLQKHPCRWTPHLPWYLEAAQELEAAQPPVKLVFSHNDPLPANFIDDGNRVWLIDFEYSAYASPLFDLAFMASQAGFGVEEDERLLEVYFQTAPDAATRRGYAAMKCAAFLREAMWSMVSEFYLHAPGADYTAYAEENRQRFDETFQGYQRDFR